MLQFNICTIDSLHYHSKLPSKLYIYISLNNLPTSYQISRRSISTSHDPCRRHRHCMLLISCEGIPDYHFTILARKHSTTINSQPIYLQKQYETTCIKFRYVSKSKLMFNNWEETHCNSSNADWSPAIVLLW